MFDLLISAKGGGFSPDWHVIFHVIWFLNTNGDVVKNNWLWKFRKFSEKFLWQSLFRKLQVCVVQTATPLQPEFTADYFQNMFQKNYIPGFITEIFPSGFRKRALYKISEKLLFDIFVISYLTILQASNLKVVTSLKIKCLTKTYRTNF